MKIATLPLAWIGSGRVGSSRVDDVFDIFDEDVDDVDDVDVVFKSHHHPK